MTVVAPVTLLAVAVTAAELPVVVVPIVRLPALLIVVVPEIAMEELAAPVPRLAIAELFRMRLPLLVIAVAPRPVVAKVPPFSVTLPPIEVLALMVSVPPFNVAPVIVFEPDKVRPPIFWPSVPTVTVPVKVLLPDSVCTAVPVFTRLPPVPVMIPA